MQTHCLAIKTILFLLTTRIFSLSKYVVPNYSNAFGHFSMPHGQVFLFAYGQVDRGHETAVAGIMLYGDQLQGKDYTGCKPMWLTSCIVNTDPDKVLVEEYKLIEHIREAIKSNPDVKVWNLSQGSKEEVDDSSFSDFAIALDNIQLTNHTSQYDDL